jgi:hypothetical protein
MKKFIYISLVIFFCIIIFKGCFTSEPEKLVSPEIIQSVMSITDNNKYVSITSAKDEFHYFVIRIKILFVPQSISEVKTFTDAVCESCYKFFKTQGIERSIYVHAYRPKDKDLTIMYGTTRYDEYSGKFTFEIAK